MTKYTAEVRFTGLHRRSARQPHFAPPESARPGSAFVSLPMDVMTGQAQCKPIGMSRFTDQGPAAEASLREAARLINAARTPVVFRVDGQQAEGCRCHSLLLEFSVPCRSSRPFRLPELSLESWSLPLAGRVGQLANQPADEVLEAADLVLTIGYDAVEYWPSLWNNGRIVRSCTLTWSLLMLRTAMIRQLELIGSIRRNAGCFDPAFASDRRSTVSPKSPPSLESLRIGNRCWPRQLPVWGSHSSPAPHRRNSGYPHARCNRVL